VGSLARLGSRLSLTLGIPLFLVANRVHEQGAAAEDTASSSVRAVQPKSNWMAGHSRRCKNVCRALSSTNGLSSNSGRRSSLPTVGSTFP
jgi:hypothetical protein